MKQAALPNPINTNIRNNARMMNHQFLFDKVKENGTKRPRQSLEIRISNDDLFSMPVSDARLES